MVAEGEAATPEAKAALQAKLDAAEEAVFVAAAGGGDASVPRYEGTDGVVYNREGEPVEVAKDALPGMRSDTVVPVRCPHGPTACKIASLIRIVKAESDSIGGTVMAHITNMPIGLGPRVLPFLSLALSLSPLRASDSAAFYSGGVAWWPPGGIRRGSTFGAGEPCFDKLEAKMAHAMLSLPATKVRGGHKVILHCHSLPLQVFFI